MKKSVSLLASLLLLLLPLLTLAAEPSKTLTPKSIDSKKTLPNSVETKNTEKGSLIPGGYTPIKDVKTPLVQGLGKFAVFKHNQKTGDHLKFLEVYAGEVQVVEGFNYKLKIKTAIDGLPFNYEALVYADLKGILHLISFTEIVLYGGYYRIEDVNTTYIQFSGKFAVDVYNIKNHRNLKFNEVYDGASQVVAGTNYRLLLTATDGGIFGKYVAVLFVDLKNNRYFKSLDPIINI